MPREKKLTWEKADSEIIQKLKDIQARGGKIVLLSSTVISPSAESIIAEFQKAYPSTLHVTYDTASCSSMLQANDRTFGVKAIPTYRFDKADLIVSFDADFLGTWISPVEFTEQYASGRKLKDNKDTMNRHIQFESGMSITGSNADERVAVKPSDEWPMLSALLKNISGQAVSSSSPFSEEMKKLAGELKNYRGRSLVISGSSRCQYPGSG